MKRFTEITKFMKHVGVLTFDDFEEADIVPDSWMGHFDPKSFERLENFCANNPQYHIVAFTDPPYCVNDAIPHGKLFQLARGDNDPSIYYLPKSNKKDYETLQIVKGWKHKS